jgi:formylglycine-generating enzyme required for sulfatase activity
MSSPDRDHSADLSGRETAENPPAKPDLNRPDATRDPNATGGFLRTSFDSPGTWDPFRPGSYLPAIPGYVIEGELGRGGMGVVYRGRQTELHRLVAIKMILGGKYTDLLTQARFVVEAEVIAAIQHPHVVQLYEFGRHDDQPYFVLEYVGGGSLADRLKAVGRFSPRDAATMVAKLADGMAAAHRKGVVHRDLKPANVLLTETGEPKITDFGLAKIGQSDMTETGAVMGTACYMSPEQAAGKNREVGTPADVYALGAILYELMTGQRTFQGESAMAMFQQVLTQEPPRPRVIDRKIPRDLETICLKCMDKDWRKRYGTAAELATELRAFLDGRPITARPVGVMERMWKWAKRNPGWAGSLAAGVLLLVVATLAGLVIREQIREQQKATRAAGLVQAVRNADIAHVPAIIEEISGYRQWTDAQLRDENLKAAHKSRQKLNTSLALLPVDPGQVPYLYERLLEAHPQEVLVIRDALAPHQGKLQDKLWAVVETPGTGKESQRLAAATALATYDPENERWARARSQVAHDFVKVPAVYLASWMSGLHPVRGQLLQPLASLFRDRSHPETERSQAAEILADYTADQAPFYADLLLDADTRQFAVLFPRLKDHGETGLALLQAELDRQPPADGKHEDGERLAKRKARAAVALLRSNRPDPVWPLFQHSADPTVRSYLIHCLGVLEVPPSAVIQRLDAESNVSIRRALVLCLGEFRPDAFVPQEQAALVERLREIYRTADDAGLHGAAQWLLYRWGHDAWLAQDRERCAQDNAEREQKLDRIRTEIRGRAASATAVMPAWYVNSQGQTMVVIPGPIEFLMGSPLTETGRFKDDPPQHRRRIGRSFAIAAEHVTIELFRRFRKDHPYYVHAAPTEDCPMPNVSWYLAAEYCNWLSKQEGLPESEWCYEPNSQGQYADGMKLAPNYLQRTGYRLPTEAEWECACRAGAVTGRYYGDTEELLRNYAWYLGNAANRRHPVAQFKPNDWGLFDMHGNVHTWCLNVKNDVVVADGKVLDDQEEGHVIHDKDRRSLRGSAYNADAAFVRCVARIYVSPKIAPPDVNVDYGFRLARTIR